MIGRRSAGVVALALAAAACGSACTAASGEASTGTSATDRTGLTVFAAASLRSVMEAVATTYEGAHPGTTITLATDSSAALAIQIEQGAPADVFLSADTRHPQALVDDGLADGQAVAFAGNELAIIVPSGDPGEVATPADLGRDGVRIIAAGTQVPITRYATQLIANLAALEGSPADFVAAYEANVASREDNVAAVVAKIELGEGDAGIVYRTDAAASDTVRIEIPERANVRATYAGVVVGATDDPAAARSFLDWLVGADGQAVLAGFGFLPPPS